MTSPLAIPDVEAKLREYEAKHHAMADIARLIDVADNVVDLFRNGRQVAGDPLPWRKTHELVRLRPDEVSIWAGFNSAGKTLILSDVMLNNVSHDGGSWAVASLEMPILRLAERAVIQCAGNGKPTEKYIRSMLEWATNKIWVYDQTETVKSARIFAFCHLAFDYLKVSHVVIDSLVKCGIDSRDPAQVSEFVSTLQQIAKQYHGHIHLVHHLRKKEDETSIPSKQDLTGAGQIADLADNIFILWRNKRKEMRLDAGEVVEPNEPDAVLLVEKQQHFEWSGKIRLWFESQALRYLGNSVERRKWYGPELKEFSNDVGH